MKLQTKTMSLRPDADMCPIAWHIKFEGTKRGLVVHNPITNKPYVKTFPAKHFKCGMGDMCNRSDKGRFNVCVERREKSI